MILLEQVKKIINSFDLKPIDCGGYMNIYQLLKNNDDVQNEMNKYKSNITDSYLNDKFEKHIPHGWYGFDIGFPINPDWMIILEQVVDLCVSNDSDFEIHQIKLKYGGIRFYCESKIIEDIGDISSIIMGTLYDKALIY